MHLHLREFYIICTILVDELEYNNNKSIDYLEADSSVSICVEDFEHLIDEEPCLGSWHHVHGHDVFLVQGARRTRLYKPPGI